MAYILILDTQAQFRQQLIRLIEQAGHRATAVATIVDATRIIHEITPDLLATNVALTDGSSANLVERLTKLGAKTLMMTGNSDRIREFEGAGRPYVSTPFTQELFLQRVEEILAAA